jgi:hypothetical protein
VVSNSQLNLLSWQAGLAGAQRTLWQDLVSRYLSGVLILLLRPMRPRPKFETLEIKIRFGESII